MKALLLPAVLLAASIAVPAYQNGTNDQSAGQDLKNAGSNTKKAAKKGTGDVADGTKKATHATARGVKKGATKSTYESKKGAHKAASETEKGADKVKQKTEDTNAK